MKIFEKMKKKRKLKTIITILIFCCNLKKLDTIPKIPISTLVEK